MKNKSSQKERPPLQSILFLLEECTATLKAFDEIYFLFTKIGNMKESEKLSLSIKPETIRTLTCITRDHFCVRMANLFEKRKDVHSLIANYNGEAIEKLKKHPVVKVSIMARHHNIGHLSKKYVKWPSLEDIAKASVEIRELIEGIKIGILFTR